MTFSELELDVVILTCAVSAGIHAALAPMHFRESAGAGLGFVAATVLLAGAVVALTRRPSEAVLISTVVLLAGLIVSYLLAVSTGLPVVHPDREAVDALGLVTKGVEAAGLVLAARLARRQSLSLLPQPKGMLT